MDTPRDKTQMVSVIIPAYNEGSHIHEVLEVVHTHPQVGQLIVVDDGSDDNTSEVARRYTTDVIRLDHNAGKAHAMDVGVQYARYEVILFLDADLIHLTHTKISQIINPVLQGEYTMYAGLRDKKVYWINKIVRMTPIITGERALEKSLWYMVPVKYKKNFQIEIALNFFAKKTDNGMGFELLKHHAHRPKYKKYGYLRGWILQVGMFKDLIIIGIKIYIGENIRWLFASSKQQIDTVSEEKSK